MRKPKQSHHDADPFYSSSPRKRKQPETEKQNSKRRLQSSPLSDDSPSETSVNMEDRRVELEKPHIPQQQRDQPKEYAREYQRERPTKSEQARDLQPREYPEYQNERPREYVHDPSREQLPPRVYEYQRETSQRGGGDYAIAAQREQPPSREYHRGSPPGLPTIASIPYSQPALPDISTLPIPIRSTSPMNISIHREPITAFPLFHQVMPDIAQYHLGASKPNTPPESSGAESAPKRRQEPCRPGHEYPIDSPFDSRHTNPPTHPLFP